MDGAQLIVHVTDNFAILQRIIFKMTDIKVIATHSDSAVRKEKLNGQSATERTNVSKSVVALKESVGVREVLRFYLTLNNLKQLLLQH